MQSTSSLLEDTRQPPSLCPVCLTKIAYAVSVDLLGRGSVQQQENWIRDRYAALRKFCIQKRQTVEDTILWAGLEAWLSSMLAMEGKGTGEEVDIIDLT
jgi:archaemetzincin